MNSTQPNLVESDWSVGWVEKVISLLAVLVCLVVTVWVWGIISSQQPMWPFPALYLFEMIAVTTTASVVTVLGLRLSFALTWVATGVVLAFSGLAMFSVGLFYLPVAVLLALAAAILTWRMRRSALVAFTLMLVAGVVQIVVTLLLVNVNVVN
jgi:hypothetical protein